MQAVWHGEMQLITDLDRVFEQGEDKNIDVVKREVRQYEKEIKKRGAAVVNQERTKAEKEKTQKTKAKRERKTNCVKVCIRDDFGITKNPEIVP